MNNIPKLRFKEFSGEWKSKAINEVAKINPKSKELPDEFIYVDLESVNKGMLIKQNLITKTNAPSRAQRVLQKNDILFQTVRPYQKNNYYFNLDGNYIASTGYAQINANESSQFLYQKIHTDKFVNKVLLRCTGTSYPAINSSDFSSLKIHIPTKPEQQKIASFLTSVDKKIELLTQKEKLLKDYKKGVMQKIFSQEIRFKPDDGSEFPEWVEKKLGDVLDYEQPTKYIVESTEYNSNYDIPVLTAGKSFILGYTNEKNGVYKNIPVIIFDDFTTSNNFVNFEFKVKSSAMKILKNKNDSINIKFVYELMQMLHFPIGEHKRYWISEYSCLKIKLPCLDEQTKIANFLSAIDTKIEQVAKQLDHTKEFKKGLLQQMFV